MCSVVGMRDLFLLKEGMGRGAFLYSPELQNLQTSALLCARGSQDSLELQFYPGSVTETT
jgi:hypothetical protein